MAYLGEVGLVAGNNNAANVDVLSIAAGDNNIGNVDLASAIPAGTNNIGDVDVLTQVGTANMANGQVAASTTEGTLVAARATRRSVTIRNLDASISVYIGVATVTANNGMLLKAEESISLETTALIQVISASGTPNVAYIELYS